LVSQDKKAKDEVLQALREEFKEPIVVFMDQGANKGTKS